MRPRLLDLFAGAGGCSVGYHRAGFDVTGVDIEPHADYPYELIVADAMTFPLDGYDVVHASPPCPRYSVATPDRYRDDHPDLLGPTLELLRSWGGVWVVENVPGSPMPDPVLLCGRAMGLRWTRRHRLFASNVPLLSPGCACGVESPYGVTGDGPEIRDYARSGRKARSVEHAREVMGIDWMTRWGDLADAIPPEYTRFIGEQLLSWLPAADDGFGDSSPEHIGGISAFPGRRTGSRLNTDALADSASSEHSHRSASVVSGVRSRLSTRHPNALDSHKEG